MSLPSGACALVTGARSGIGRAVAHELAEAGAHLLLTARDAHRLDDVKTECERRGAKVETRTCDLLDDAAVAALGAAALAALPRLDVLVHAAGSYSFRPLADLELNDFQDVFRVNLRAPFHLTRRLLTALRGARGQVVFVNSSAVDRAQPSTGAYTASKHALRGLADVWRAELNGDGVRVLSVFPGRTATPMQEEVARAEGTVYRPADLLQPADVARAIGDALRMPRSAEVTEVRLRPTRPPRP